MRVNGSIPAGYNGIPHAHCSYCGSCLTHKASCHCKMRQPIDPQVLALFGAAARLAIPTASKPTLSWHDDQEPRFEPNEIEP